jgi:hypothetical protein
MSAWQILSDAFDRWRTRQAQRPFSGSIPVEGEVAGWNLNSSFQPEESYFSVRLVEIHLSESGKYFRDFLPLAVCVAERAGPQSRDSFGGLAKVDHVDHAASWVGAGAGASPGPGGASCIA